jgi:SNF2 family DNA or RNA helicase
LLDDITGNYLPLGVLFLRDIPKFPGSGINAPDGWDWFCYGLVDLSRDQITALCPELKALAFLSESLYTRVTYKFVDTAVLCLRVYHILSDFCGSSAIAELRPRTKTHDQKRQKNLEIMLTALEFDPDLWKGNWIRRKYAILRAFGPSSSSDTISDSGAGIDRLLEANSVSETNQMIDMSPKDRLLQIYRSIDSPVLKCENLEPETEYLIQLAQSQDVAGLKTQLYSYQVTSVCKMLQVEMQPENTLLPYLVPMSSKVNGQMYYVNQTDCTFSQYPTFYTTPRGGILAEDMGLGKSLICLALTVLTRGQSSSRPEDIFYDNKELGEQHPLSLAECCVQSVLQNNISWRLYKDELPKACVNKLLASPGYYYSRSEHINRALKQAELNRSSINMRNSSRNSSHYSTQFESKKIWLSCSTLIICPRTLFDQWRYEIAKHLDTAVISTLYLTNSKFQTPDSQKLIEYDIVLISAPRFALEENDKESPFKQVLWKRLIIDEGHTMSSTKSRLSFLAKGLYAERRWAVTGTPTPGLTRMSTHSTEKHNQVSVQFSVKQELERLGSIIENFLMVEPWTSSKSMWHREIAKPFLSNQPRSDANVKRILGQLVIRHKETDVNSDIILPPLHLSTVFLEPSFSNKLAINLFVSVINVNAVTSEREDQDYLLNPTNRSDLKRLMSNLQIASFYWSGFSEKDLQSLHDIANVYIKKMDKVNKALAENDPNLPQILGTSKRLTKMSLEEQAVDRNLLLQAIDTVKVARYNKQWENISKSHEMCYYTDQLPITMLLKIQTDPTLLSLDSLKEKSKSMQPTRGYDMNRQCKYFRVGGTQLVNYKQKMGYYDNDIDLTVKLDIDQSSFTEGPSSETFANLLESGKPLSKFSDCKIKARKKKLMKKVKLANGNGKTKTKTKSTINTTTTTAGDSGIAGFIPAVSKFVDGVSSSPMMASSAAATPEQFSRPPSPFPLESNDVDAEACQLLGTASAKLSYLISRLIELTKTEKCIVFYEFDDIAFYIAEALDIIGIKYLIYANSVTPIQRSKYLAEFHVNNEFRVLLMNVRLAAHGLNVSTASRVFFVNPIWRNDIESQAIKRAHRIGQRLPVYVETLVLKGTMEETVVSYRHQQQTAAASTTNAATDKDTNQEEITENKLIQNFIANHPYTPIHPHESEVDWLFFSPESNKKVYPFKKNNNNASNHDDKITQRGTMSTNSTTTIRAPILKTSSSSVSTSKRPSSPATNTKVPKRVKFS